MTVPGSVVNHVIRILPTVFMFIFSPLVPATVPSTAEERTCVVLSRAADRLDRRKTPSVDRTPTLANNAACRKHHDVPNLPLAVL
jgi:hypothetical protein